MSALDLFQYDGRQVRVVVIEGEPWFVLADLCRVLEISNPSNVAARLDEATRQTYTLRQPEGNRGNPNVTIVSEAGMYEVVIRSDKPEAVAFRRWITSDVLPTIRKTGRYGSDVDMLAALPSSKLLQLAAQAAERAEAAEAKIAADAPKVLFADAVSASDDSILVARLAGLLRQNGVDIGQNRLFERLREEGYLGRRGESYNRPTQRALDLGLFEVIERTVQGPDGSPRLTFTPKVTGKGQAYFVNRYIESDGVLDIEAVSA